MDTLLVIGTIVVAANAAHVLGSMNVAVLHIAVQEAGSGRIIATNTAHVGGSMNVAVLHIAVQEAGSVRTISANTAHV